MQVKITEKDALYVAGLANLELEQGETKQLAVDLDSILGYVEKLNELDTSSVEPMAQVLYEGAAAFAWRGDNDREGFTQAKALVNAPDPGALG